jgi:hypothetical protein
MRYLKMYEELSIDWNDKQDFIKEIKDIFLDEVVDKTDIELFPDNEANSGVFYHFNDFPLSLGMDKPYLEICLYYGGDDYRSANKNWRKLKGMQPILNKFIDRVRVSGFQCNQVMSMEEYEEYSEDTSYEVNNREPLVITVYYN